MSLKTVVRRMLHPKTCSDHVCNLDGSVLWCSLPKPHDGEKHQAKNGSKWGARVANGILTIEHPE